MKKLRYNHPLKTKRKHKNRNWNNQYIPHRPKMDDKWMIAAEMYVNKSIELAAKGEAAHVILFEP